MAISYGYELMTTDTAAAEDFYRGVIGWGAEDAGMPGMYYTLFRSGETSVAGMMALLPARRAPGPVGSAMSRSTMSMQAPLK